MQQCTARLAAASGSLSQTVGLSTPGSDALRTAGRWMYRKEPAGCANQAVRVTPLPGGISGIPLPLLIEASAVSARVIQPRAIKRLAASPRRLFVTGPARTQAS